MSTVVKAVDIKKVYDLGQIKITALDGVSLDIQKGEFVSITGKSGSGKSTLMHIIGLLDSPTSGIITINGTDTTEFSEKQLARFRNKEIGFVFQAYNLLQRTNAIDNVILPLKYSQVPQSEWKEKAKKLLEAVGLGERLYNKSNELSGGQKQRVAIARALVNDPSILFADEPTGNLDSKTGDEIVELFKELNDQGKTIILVTHDEELAQVAKRQIVLRDGQVIQS